MKTEKIRLSPRESLLNKIIFSDECSANVLRINYLAGLGFGLSGRAIGQNWLALVPYVLDIFTEDKKKLKKMSYWKSERYPEDALYWAGFYTANIDKIYSFISKIL